MEDLGLVSLRSIVRGAVRIERNPQLCYVDTIDWTELTSVDHKALFVLQNKVCRIGHTLLSGAVHCQYDDRLGMFTVNWLSGKLLVKRLVN